MSTKLFEPHPWNLEELFKHIYEVPVYQRPYSWDIDQVETLLSDVYSSFEENKDVSYYVGNIILHDKNEKVNGSIPKFQVIDGQQRITTFCLFLLALHCLMTKFSVDETDDTYLSVKKCLWKYINRTYSKEYQAVTLNSIEKDSLKDLYDYCYSSRSLIGFDIKNFCDNYSKKNDFEKRIFKNFIHIYDSLYVKFSSSRNNFLDFADYVIKNIDFIVIETTTPENKVFNMFESINSKGKKLDEIDLFKTYIFSHLDSSDYKSYLDIWGELITETEDNLYDYIYNFIKAYICFYRQNIYIQNFKSLSRDELLTYYYDKAGNSVPTALKLFLNDLKSNVKYYKMLLHPEKASSLINNNKFKFYFYLFTALEYRHPKPLFLRAFSEYENGKYDSKNELIDIISETTTFMVNFLTISKRASKDVITLFSSIMNSIYKDGKIEVEKLKQSIAAELSRESLTTEKLKDKILTMDAYSQNKNLTKALLSLYEATSKDKNNKYKTFYDQAYVILKNFNDAFSLDHLLVQTPDKNSIDFLYYKNETNNTLVLKDGHDFPLNEVQNGMDYDVFTSSILNKIGNLRICYKDKNSSRGNHAIDLKTYENFTTYNKIVTRSEEIANVIFDHIFTLPKVGLPQIQFASADKDDVVLPNIDELINAGFLNVGDELYIKGYAEDSKATLLDSKYIDFKGNKISLNEWAHSVTKLKDISIYEHIIKLEDNESIQEKRLRLIEAENN